MKFGISLERVGDLLLSFVNRAEAVSAHMENDDLRDFTVMTSQLERMLADVDIAFRTRSLDKAVDVLRADAELDRVRNVITFRHLERQKDSEIRQLSRFVYGTGGGACRRPCEKHGGRSLPPGKRTNGSPCSALL